MNVWTMLKFGLITLFSSMLVFSLPALAPGDPPRHDWKPKKTDSCLSLDELELSARQRSEALEISGPCRDHLIHLRTELIGKHMELRRMLRDPSVTEEEIETAWEETEELHVSMRREVKRYSLGIRRILTPEQIRDWCALVEIYPRRGRR
jgi:Spy/CpxP family protein refolding chaperone